MTVEIGLQIEEELEDFERKLKPQAAVINEFNKQVAKAKQIIIKEELYPFMTNNV